LGLPADFEPVQNNISFNEEIGVTRGLHAEPWDKYISVGGRGRVFGAWVDLRAGKSFGNVYYTEINEGKAIYVPRGVANGFQTLTENTVYTYLVNAHWSPEAKYSMVNQADPELGIPWPIDLAKAIVSEKDLNHPSLEKIKSQEGLK
jgi:dTDP-4-dehydrorhamnose 3,5-epimerase